MSSFAVVPLLVLQEKLQLINLHACIHCICMHEIAADDVPTVMRYQRLVSRVHLNPGPRILRFSLIAINDLPLVIGCPCYSFSMHDHTVVCSGSTATHVRMATRWKGRIAIEC